MFRLIEIVRNVSDEKETQSTYEYESAIDAKGDYETKLGADMKSDLYSDVLLILLDNEGDVIDQAFVGQTPFQPRLYEVKVTNEEVANMSKYDNDNLVIANFHSKWGSAIKNRNVKAEMLRGFNGSGSTLAFTYWVRPTTEEG